MTLSTGWRITVNTKLTNTGNGMFVLYEHYKSDFIELMLIFFHQFLRSVNSCSFHLMKNNFMFTTCTSHLLIYLIRVVPRKVNHILKSIFPTTALILLTATIMNKLVDTLTRTFNYQIHRQNFIVWRTSFIQLIALDMNKFRHLDSNIPYTNTTVW